MTISDFEAMIARASYVLKKIIKEDDGTEVRRLYISPGRPGLNMPIEDGEIDDWTALKVEVLLNEKGFSQGDVGADEGEPGGG